MRGINALYLLLMLNVFAELDQFRKGTAHVNFLLNLRAVRFTAPPLLPKHFRPAPARPGTGDKPNTLTETHWGRRFGYRKFILVPAEVFPIFAKRYT